MRAVMNFSPRMEKRTVKIFVNGSQFEEMWNNFNSISQALNFLSSNYGDIHGVNFLMDDISIRQVEEKQYSVRFI